MKEIRVSLDEQEDNIIKEFKELEDLTSKEKAIKKLIMEIPEIIPEIQERIKSKEKYKRKQK